MRKKGKFHWCSLTVFIGSVLPSLQHDFEAALAAKDAIIEQLRRDLQEMQAKLDVSEGVGVDVSEGVGVGVSGGVGVGVSGGVGVGVSGGVGWV